MQKEILQRMVTRQQASAMFGISAGTLSNLFSQGKGPKAFRVGRRILYRVSDLEAFFTSRPVEIFPGIEEKR